MDKTLEAFAFKYLETASPTGFEREGQRVWLDFIKPYVDEWEQDSYGTVYGIINPGTDYRVVIEAHADEISWFVNYITDEGFIHVIKNGGSDEVIAPSKRVFIHTPNGKVRGVFGWPAIHIRRGKTNTPATSVENLFIDVGADSKEEVLKMGIDVGSVVTFADSLEKLNDKYFIGRALDNRMGGVCIAQVARMLKEQKVQLPYTLYIVNSVQEEIGLRGAEMIAHRIKPNVAIVTDVTHDTTTPHIKKKVHGDVRCGKGPVVTIAPAIHRKLLSIIFEAADATNIPLQKSVSSRSTGTDTDAFAYSNSGVPSALISLPLRYMHTTVEMAAISDIDHVAQLIFETLKRIEHGQKFTYV